MKIKPFWYKNKGGGIEINEGLLVEFLSQLGFAGYYLSRNRAVEPQYVYKTGNIIEPIIPIRVHEETIRRIASGAIDENLLPGKYRSFLITKLIKTNCVVKKEVLTILPELDKPLISDTKDIAYFFFRNTVVRVTRDVIQLLPFDAFEGYVWKSQIVDRDFVLVNYEEVVRNSEYYQFFKNITSLKTGDKWESNEERFNNLITIQGYLLHCYKNRANPRAVILMDSSDRGEPDGRTGKGLIVEGIGKIRKMIKEDGKSFQDENRFKFSLITPDTKILFLDDVRTKFNFENFFSAISEGIMVEPKFVNKFFIPFENSPKIVISTNYAVLGRGASHEARRYEFPLSTYYNEKHTPINDFHHLFFDEWELYQWSLFDNLMMHSVSKYLEKGVINSDVIIIKYKKLVAETSESFARWANVYSIKPEVHHNKGILFEEFGKYCENGPDCDQMAFTKYLKKWARLNNLYVMESHSGDIRYIRFIQECNHHAQMSSV